MNEDFVTYEQAVQLKELGFNWYNQYSQMYYATQNYCEGSNQFFFDTIGPGDLISSPRMKEDENDGWIEDEDYCVLAPTLAQAQKWLREVKGVKVYIKPLFSSEEYEYWISFKFQGFMVGNECYGVEETWEYALSAGISEAIKLVRIEELRNKR